MLSSQHSGVQDYQTLRGRISALELEGGCSAIDLCEAAIFAMIIEKGIADVVAPADIDTLISRSI